jgi:hypothetical protein
MMAADLIDKLKAEGWFQRFTASGFRLQEATENYRMLGFEIKTVPIKELEQNGCTVCFEDESDDTVMIFTREKPAAQVDDLYDDSDE